MPGIQPDRRATLEDKWRSRRDCEFPWHVPGPPPQLVDLLNEGAWPDGAALDLGCGSGAATTHLARYFRPAVGVDLALPALRQAEELASGHPPHARFVVADVPRLPFSSGAFAFIFDRGCLQSVPQEAWAAYFIEVERLLKPGGGFQLLTSKPSWSLTGALHMVRARLRSLAGGDALGRGKREFISDASISRLLPASMGTILLEHFSFRLANGIVRDFTHGVFRRT